jgi:hypothetical protein
LSYTPKVTSFVRRSPTGAVSSIGAGWFARAKQAMPCSTCLFSVTLVFKARPGLPANQKEQRERR